MSGSWRLLTRRDALDRTRWEPVAVPDPADGAVLVEVEAVACTANTFTYGLLGERLRYWDFFPAGHPEWGCLPAWGTGVVRESACADVEVGARLFGMLPLASHCTLAPARTTAEDLRDRSPHRRGLPGAYQYYERLPAGPGPTSEELVRALVHPLFVLAFLLAAQLREDADGPTTVLLTSASSRTAQAIAQQLDGSGLTVVGLTSPPRAAACAATGLFTAVVAYPDVDDLARHPWPGARVVVDIAGDPDLRRRIRATGPARTVLVGATHRAPGTALVAAADGEREFSAVERLRVLAAAVGTAELAWRQEQAWRSYLHRCGHLVHPQIARDRAGIERAYREVLDGRCPPAHGHLLDLRAAMP